MQFEVFEHNEFPRLRGKAYSFNLLLIPVTELDSPTQLSLQLYSHRLDQ